MPNDNTDSRIVVAATFPDDVSAHIALGMLQAHGVECVLNNELTSDVFALPTASFGQVRLLVHEADLDKAVSLLRHPHQPCDNAL